MKNILPKIKPIWMEPFSILFTNYNRNDYRLDLSTHPSLNLICHTFHISKVKPYMNNNSTVLPLCQLDKPGPVPADRYEVKKATEYPKAPRTSAL